MVKTIAEIAEATGFSRTTVTMVLGGRASEYRISQRTREIIEAYVAQHGYTVNQTARNLKLKRSNTVGFVVPDLGNAFFARVMAALEMLCRSRGLVLVTASSSENAMLERQAVDNFLARGVDGIVVAPCSARVAHTAQRRRKKTPFVQIDRIYPEDDSPAISTDHLAGAREITRELISASDGQKIAFLCGHPSIPSIQQRIEGFRLSGAESGLGTDRAVVLTTQEDNVAAGGRLIDALVEQEKGLPSAILCSSLLVLEGALHGMKRRWGRIPTELVIGTFDYSGMLEVLPNRVIALRQNEDAMARAAFRMLEAQMKGREIDPQPQILPAELVRLGIDATKTAAQ